ncbi:MAG: twin-arginine translocation signal domain-containing protein [Planctomycetota bacterium]
MSTRRDFLTRGVAALGLGLAAGSSALAPRRMHSAPPIPSSRCRRTRLR